MKDGIVSTLTCKTFVPFLDNNYHNSVATYSGRGDGGTRQGMGVPGNIKPTTDWGV